MPRQFCPGIFCFAFLLPLPSGQKKKEKKKERGRGGLGAVCLLMIHTKAWLSVLYLDLEFISSSAEPRKAAADNRLHVGKAPLQDETCFFCSVSALAESLRVSWGEWQQACWTFTHPVHFQMHSDSSAAVWHESQGRHTAAVPVLTTRGEEALIPPSANQRHTHAHCCIVSAGAAPVQMAVIWWQAALVLQQLTGNRLFLSSSFPHWLNEPPCCLQPRQPPTLHSTPPAPCSALMWWQHSSPEKMARRVETRLTASRDERMATALSGRWCPVWVTTRNNFF